MPLFGPPNVEKMKATGNVKGLAKALEYKKDPSIREAAAETLGKIEARTPGEVKTLVGSLLQALEDESKSVREAAATALKSKTGDLAYLKEIFDLSFWHLIRLDNSFRQEQLIKDQFAFKANFLAEVLGNIAPDTLRNIGKKRGSCANHLAVILRASFMRGEPRVDKMLLIRTIGQLGETDSDVAIDTLGWVLISGVVDLHLKKTAAEALGNMRARSMDAEKALAHVLTTGKDVGLQKTAAEALGNMRASSSAAKEALADVLTTSKVVGLQKAAVEALANIGPSAVELLVSALSNTRKDVRRAAAEALGEHKSLSGRNRAMEGLKEVLDDPDKKVRKAAAEALDKLASLVMDVEDVHKLKRKGDLEGLIKALHYEHNIWVRQEAAMALREVGGEGAVEPLISVLKNHDEHKMVRGDAANSLGQLGDTRAIEPLIAALEDDDDSVKSNAARALSAITGLSHSTDRNLWQQRWKKKQSAG